MTYKPQSDTIMEGTAAAIPTCFGDNADDIGRLYYATDTEILYRWSGSVWEEYGNNPPAGSSTVLYDNTLAEAGAWDVSSLSQGYDDLEIRLLVRSSESADYSWINVSFNNDTTDANYHHSRHFASSGGHGANTYANRQFVQAPGATSPDYYPGFSIIHIPSYTATAFYKVFRRIGGLRQATYSIDTDSYGYWLSTSAINRVTIAPASGDFIAGSRLTIIGHKYN